MYEALENMGLEKVYWSRPAGSISWVCAGERLNMYGVELDISGSISSFAGSGYYHQRI